MRAEYQRRHREIIRRLNARGADALIVTHAPNVYYLSGFTGSAGVLVIGRSKPELFTDGRYAVQAPQETRDAGIRVQVAKSALLAAAGASLASKKRIRAVFDPARTTVAALRTVENAAGKNVSWQVETNWIEELREIKSEDELKRMGAAARLGSRVMESAMRQIKPGVKESDLAAEIEYQMRKLGAEGPSFETIVASGKRSALPHARPTDKRIRRNELVVLDLGAILARYCSDLTRTVFVGRAPKRVKTWYKAVAEAQLAGRDALSAGVKAGAADGAARKVLAGYGLADRFTHSLGHGLGLEVHEDPRLAAGQERVLRAGNVVTVEPGVYVEGVGGIRIEDDVVIQQRGVEVLTTATRELLEI